MSKTPNAAPSTTPATIASAPLLPPRVRRILTTFFAHVATDLGERINLMLVEFEQQLFKSAERARSNEKQAEQFANLHALRKSRSDLLPMFLAGLEAEIASIRDLRHAPVEVHERIEYQTLTLVEDAEMDQDIVLREIARRHDSRTHTPLYLMGQRFGVLAGSPAFDAALLPIGPQALCRILRAAAGATFEIDLDSQLVLYKSFDQKVMAEYTGWIDVLNDLLARQGVLPGLVYAPQLARIDKPHARRNIAEPHSLHAASRPMTDWYGQASPSAWTVMGTDSGDADTTDEAAPADTGSGSQSAISADDASSFATLQQLLSGRRVATMGGNAGQAPGHGASLQPRGAVPPIPLPTQDVLSSLRLLQAQPIAAVAPGKPRRTMLDVQDTLLAQVREKHGPGATLVQQDADTFELLGLLYNEMEREVQRDAPAVDLLVRLQVPVAQAALHDREFFLRPQHPARELLNSVAESGATWLGEGDGDPQLVLKLDQAVGRVVAEYDGNDEIFENANNDVQAHFRAMARKAEVAERRHVEAARGKDRLEMAKDRAAETIEGALQGHVPQKFVQALLNQAWADVLTLGQLRNGEDSEEWREQVEITRQIVASTSEPVEGEAIAAIDPQLTSKVEAALVQVGYHGDEAAAIARRLSSADGEDETTSRTELTARLKARARLGEQAEVKKKVHVPRTPKEQECHDYLRTLPFGTWFEFATNQQGDMTRQRLSWFSPVTDNALFVNQRGQRLGEQSLDSLARLMARDQVRVVTQDKGRLIDRAWKATVKALRSFTGGDAADASDTASAGAGA